MPIKFTNNASSLLAAGITNSATSLTVTTGEGAEFPTLGASDYAYVTIVDAATPSIFEIVKVTARSGDTLTIVRAQEGTTARAWSTGAKVELRLTEQGFEDALNERLSATATVNIGTTAVPVNRASGALTLNGVSIDGSADQLGGYVRDRFVYGDNATGSINSFTGDGGVGANNLSRSCFYRDNAGQFGALGIHIQHPQSAAYALQIAAPSYSASTLQYRFENNGTWSGVFTLLDSANFNNYSPTLTGTGASGTWGISISGSAATLTTARTLTIGNTGKTFNGSGNVSWSLAEIGAQAAGNYVTTDTTQTITGVKTFTGAVDLRKQLIASYDEYQYAWGGDQDKEWKKVAVLSSTATDGWRGTSGQIIVYDEVGNHGNAARVEHRARFSVVYSQNSTPTDTALINGSPGFGNVIRLQKIGVRNYELQVRQEIDWRLMGATLQIDFNGGDTTAITTTQVPPNGAAGISTVAAGGLIENFNISGNAATATSATSATSANTAATLATARSFTIGNTSRTFNGSGNVSWTIGDIGAEERHGLGNPRSNLGDPTVREMALFDAQFNNKTELYDIANLWFETSTDNVTWTNFAVSDTDKRKFLTGDGGTTISIPYGTAYFRIRMRATSYVYLNALYAYWSSNGHSTQVQMFRKHDSGSWEQHTSSNWLVSAWPGHLFLPFSTIPWNPTAALGTHFHEIYALFIPTWNATYPSHPIHLYRGQFWGGYPAGKRNIYTTDEFGNVTFPAGIIQPRLQSYRETVTTVTPSGGTATCDLSTANVFNVTLNAATTALAFTNPPASGLAFSFTVIVRQDATGNRALTYPASAKFTDGVSPVLATGASKVDVLTFFTVDGGATYFGGQALANL